MILFHKLLEKFKTSLKELLRSNKNIKDPNMISSWSINYYSEETWSDPVYSDLKKSEWGRIKGGTKSVYEGRLFR